MSRPLLLDLAGFAFLAIAVLAFVAIVAEVVKCVAALRGRGEVADAPEPLPVWQGCRLNATPHWCFDTADFSLWEKEIAA